MIKMQKCPRLFTGGYALVENGVIDVENSIKFCNWYTPNIDTSRTMLGVNKEGNFIVVVIQGGHGSDGATANEQAQIMKALGAVNAINLDGGGSSIFWYKGETRNKPQYTNERRIGSVLMVIPK